jgi:hypothetical protein
LGIPKAKEKIVGESKEIEVKIFKRILKKKFKKLLKKKLSFRPESERSDGERRACPELAEGNLLFAVAATTPAVAETAPAH